MGFKTLVNNLGGLFRNKLFQSEQRSGYPYNFLDGLINNYQSVNPIDGDVAITPTSAMRISTFFTCVLVRAESLASLPASVFQDTKAGKQKAYSHSAHYLVHTRPNPYQTASDFWKNVSVHIDTEGEAIAIIGYGGNWKPQRLDLIPPSEVEVKPTEDEVYYKYKGKLYPSWRILHFKDLSLDGYRGVSKVRYNAETLGYASKLKAYGRNAVGSKPPGYFTTKESFSTLAGQQKDFASDWKANIAAGKTPFLPLGLEYKHLMISPGDAQYLDAIAATKEDIYGIMRVPPTLAQNYERATFANAEQQDLVFIKYTMLPLITSIEQECNTKLFAEANKIAEEPYYMKFNVAAFMRGDFKSRAEGYRTLFNIGAIDGDTIADLEDWNKWEGGNRRYVPMNMVPTDKVDAMMDSITSPKPATAPNEEEPRGGLGYKISMRDFFNNQPLNTNDK